MQIAFILSFLERVIYLSRPVELEGAPFAGVVHGTYFYISMFTFLSG